VDVARVDRRDAIRLIYDPASHWFPYNEAPSLPSTVAIISPVRQVSKLKDWANGAFASNADIAYETGAVQK
jgi:hypothetical protein